MSRTNTAAPLPVIALVGRVNVGKSTLFNKLIEEQKAIVSDVAGTTRTSNEGIVLWRGEEIKLIDTGGLTFDETVVLEEDIIKQSERAIKEADVIVFVTDGRVGILPQELELAKRLRKKGKPILLVANKIDNSKALKEFEMNVWMKLGLGAPFLISASSGKNLGDLLDTIFATLDQIGKKPVSASNEDEGEELVEQAEEETDEETLDLRLDRTINISLIGKPNVGKSSLFNKLIGEDRVIVSDMPHTTREPFDTHVAYEHEQDAETKTQDIRFIDTAGIRRKAKVDGALEQIGISKSIQSIEESDIILFVLDGNEPISSQDKQLGGLLEKRAKSVIILINKWDLTDDNSDTRRNEVKRMIMAEFPHLSFAEVLFVSGLTGYRVHQIFPVIMHVWRARHTVIPVKALEFFLKESVKQHRPSRGKGTRFPEILGIRQLGTAPPVIELFIKYRTSLHRSYLHFIENRLREQFDLTGTPVIMKLRKQKR